MARRGFESIPTIYSNRTGPGREKSENVFGRPRRLRWYERQERREARRTERRWAREQRQEDARRQREPWIYDTGAAQDGAAGTGGGVLAAVALAALVYAASKGRILWLP